MTASIKNGLRAAARHPKLVLLIWGWYGLLALAPVLPAWTWWNAVLGYSPEAASVLKRFDLGVFLDLTRSEGVSGLSLLMAVTAAMGVIAVVSSAFVFGGVLEVFGSEDERRSFMHRFFRGGGHFFWRFVRLALAAGVCIVLATGAVSALMTAVTAPMRKSEWEPAAYLASLASIAVILAGAALFLLALDYARIRVARDDSRNMLKAYASGLAFVLRRLLTAYGIAVAIVALQAVLAAAYVAYETKTPAAGNWGAIGLLFAFQQAVVLGRVFLRIALVGAERHLHVTSLPTPVRIVAPEGDGAPVPAAVALARPEQEQEQRPIQSV
jgi:hypothetical protein